MGALEVPVFPGQDRYMNNLYRYDDWPKTRPVVVYKPELTTCGAQAGKKPLGEISQFGTRQWYPPKCDPKTSKCTYYYEVFFRYRATSKPPGKSWKYDYVRIVPEKFTKGYGALPSDLIEVLH
jgi:hypothetical protein